MVALDEAWAKARAAGGLRKDLSALNDSDKHCHESQEEQDMDEPSKRVGRQESETPEDEEEKSNSPKHGGAFRLV